jgi:hypothetical protein
MIGKWNKKLSGKFYKTWSDLKMGSNSDILGYPTFANSTDIIKYAGKVKQILILFTTK